MNFSTLSSFIFSLFGLKNKTSFLRKIFNLLSFIKTKIYHLKFEKFPKFQPIFFFSSKNFPCILIIIIHYRVYFCMILVQIIDLIGQIFKLPSKYSFLLKNYFYISLVHLIYTWKNQKGICKKFLFFSFIFLFQ